MDTAKPEWLKYEELAAMIYEKLDKQSVVTHNESIYGHNTQRNRQIDVAIRSKIGSHEILVIIEAKDRSRAPTVSTIDEFHSKLRDVAAARGVLVCRKQPSKENLKYASRLGIDICTAIDIKDHKWKDEVKIPLIVKLLDLDIKPEMSLEITGDLHLEIPERWLLSFDEGETSVPVIDYILDVLEKEKMIEGQNVFEMRDQRMKAQLGGDVWMPFGLTVKCNAKFKKVFRYCLPKEYKALKNFTTRHISISELNLELPSFSDENEWQDVTDFQEPLGFFVIADLMISNLGYRKKSVN